MSFGSVQLTPGVNAERTPTLLRAGITQGTLIRFRDSLAQKYGGWTQYYPFTVAGVPRDLHGWQDLNNTLHLAVGTTTQLGVITSNSLNDITPQTLISNFAPNFSTIMGSPTVNVVDPNISNVTVFDSVFFNTPITVGGIVLDGLYPISLVTGTHSYSITAATNATSTVTNGGAVPAFTTALGSSVISVAFAANGLATGDTVVFPIPTTGAGVTIQAAYDVVSIVGDNIHYSITAATQATASTTFSMNGGNAQLVYYINLGPPPLGTGFGLGGFGSGGFGTGTGTSTQTGSPITATDWTSDNWGEILVACPKGGGIYYWDPTGGFANASLVSSGPVYNNGIFVSMSQQILVAYGSTVHQGVGYQQEPLLVQWCDVGNFFEWDANASTQAGNFVIPIGSAIRAGIAVSNQNLIWTDLDLWAMAYIGPPDVFGFNKIGAGMGAVSSHAVQQLRGSVYWMGPTNFYNYTSNGAAVIPCPVWDAVFQNLNPNFLQNVRAMPNTPFNEVGWLYPSAASANGECDSYVKMNVTEPGAPWDYGPLPRSAWIDLTVLGNPIGATPQGIIYQHETTPDAAGQPLVASFQTGYFYIGEGEDFCFVDQFYPDFKWETFAGTTSAHVQITFQVIDNLGDTPRIYGPYTVTSATNFIGVRFRGRQMSIVVQSSDIGSFWRLGYCRWRYSPMGRR